MNIQNKTVLIPGANRGIGRTGVAKAFERQYAGFVPECVAV